MLARKALAALLVCLIGLGLRLWGVTFGLPIVSNFYTRPDESLVVVAAARLFDQAGDPGMYLYPAFMIELCAILFALLPVEFATDPSAYFLIARGISVVAGTATIGLVFIIARRVASDRAALIAALLYAVAPLAVRDAHFGVTDTLLTFLMTAAGLFAIRYVQATSEAERRALCGGAVFCGLAMATKFSGLLIVPVLCLAIAWKQRRRLRVLLAHAFALGAGAAVLFLALNPYLLLNRAESGRSMSWIVSTFYNAAQPGAHWDLGTMLWRIVEPLSHGPGLWIGLVLAALAPILLLRRRIGDGAALFVLVPALVFLVALVPVQRAVPYRYLLPTLPWIAIAAAMVIDQFPRSLGGRIAIAVMMFALLGPASWRSIEMDQVLAREDTRSAAGRWIEAHIAADTPIVVLGFPEAEPQIRESAASIERRMNYVRARYGRKSGALISQLYELQLRQPRAGYEVYRNALPPLDADTVIVATPSHPLKFGQHDPALLAALGGTREHQAHFQALDPGASFEFDSVDAFFLPFDSLDRVQQPGPNIDIWLVRR